MKRATLVLTAILLAAAGLGTTSPVTAAVPGKPFTETGCDEYTDSVARLYTAGLGREAEQGGFEFWVAEYMASRYSLFRMAVFFTQSPEFVQSYGDPTNREFVEIMYRNVLGREGEAVGVDFWTGELDAGRRNRATILLNFAESPENIHRSGTAQPALGPFNSGQPAGFWNCHNTNPGQPTIAQQNAIERAADYLAFTSFSRSALIDQLEFEKYGTEDAIYAVDSLTIDFDAQAVLKAAQYLEFTAFSRLGLIDQLEFEGFTTAQAVHGADAQGTDYFEQAEQKAAQYLEFSSFSCQGLINQLEFEEFTAAEAIHGANSTGVCS